MENKIKHLEMIQNIIDRMARSSFFLKGWSVIFVAAVFGFVLKESKPTHVWLAVIPTLSFWALDGFYLKQEKLFRKLYDKVRDLEDEEVDFSMDTSQVKEDVKNWFFICFSRTILFIYLPILAVILVVLLWNLLVLCPQ